MADCQIKWLETSSRSYCATHQRDEIECVKAELQETKLQLGEWQETASQLVQRLHDISGHTVSIQLCEATLCYETVHKLGKSLKQSGEKGVFCLTHRKVMVNGICPKCGQQ